MLKTSTKRAIARAVQDGLLGVTERGQDAIKFGRLGVLKWMKKHDSLSDQIDWSDVLDGAVRRADEILVWAQSEGILESTQQMLGGCAHYNWPGMLHATKEAWRTSRRNPYLKNFTSNHAP